MSEFRMPPVHVGQTVLWKQDLSDPRPSAAIVTSTGTRSIAVWVIPPASSTGMSIDGVRHVSDPDKDIAGNKEDGFWDYTEGSRPTSKMGAVK